MSSGAFDTQPSLWRERYLPIAVLGGGVVVNFVLWYAAAQNWQVATMAAFGLLAIQVVVFLPVAAGAMYVTARMFDVTFGPWQTALLGMGSVAVGAGAVADFLCFGLLVIAGFDHWNLAVGMVIYVILCGIPLVIIFLLSLNEMVVTVGVMILPRMATIFLLGHVFENLF